MLNLYWATVNNEDLKNVFSKTMENVLIFFSMYLKDFVKLIVDYKGYIKPYKALINKNYEINIQIY